MDSIWGTCSGYNLSSFNYHHTHKENAVDRTMVETWPKLGQWEYLLRNSKLRVERKKFSLSYFIGKTGAHKLRSLFLPATWNTEAGHDGSLIKINWGGTEGARKQWGESRWLHKFLKCSCLILSSMRRIWVFFFTKPFSLLLFGLS